MAEVSQPSFLTVLQSLASREAKQSQNHREQEVKSLSIRGLGQMKDEEEATSNKGVELEDDTIQLSWWEELKAEIKLPDTFTLNEVDGTTIDAIQSFAPDPISRTRILRMIMICIDIGSFAWDYAQADEASYNLIYLTHWTAYISIFYITCSLLCIWMPDKILVEVDDKRSVSVLAKVTWELAALCLPINAVVVLMYWVLVYDGGTVTYFNLWMHLFSFLIVVLDTLVIGRVPIRAKQFRSPILFAVTYLCWTLIHAATSIGNGMDDDESDDAIYESLSWNNRPGQASFYAVLIICIVLPFFFIVFHRVSYRIRKGK